MKKPTFFEQLSARWKADSPKFFDRIKAFGDYMVKLGGGIAVIPVAIETIVPGSNIPLSILVIVGAWIASLGLVAIAVAAATVTPEVKDKNIIKE